MPEVTISEELEIRCRNLPEDGNNEEIPSLQTQVPIVGQVGVEQTKKEGVRYPFDRVTSYRSEIRPARWTKTIWLGSFESEDEAMRAYDAALHAIGKFPVHYVYPCGYHKPILCHLKNQEMVLNYVESIKESHTDVQAFKKMIKEKASCASKSLDKLPLVKVFVDQVLSELPDPLPGAMDCMPPLVEEIEVPSEDVAGRVLVLAVSANESAMPLHQQLPGGHSSTVDAEENMMFNGEVEH